MHKPPHIGVVDVQEDAVEQDSLYDVRLQTPEMARLASVPVTALVEVRREPEGHRTSADLPGDPFRGLVEIDTVRLQVCDRISAHEVSECERSFGAEAFDRSASCDDDAQSRDPG